MAYLHNSCSTDYTVLLLFTLTTAILNCKVRFGVTSPTEVKLQEALQLKIHLIIIIIMRWRRIWRCSFYQQNARVFGWDLYYNISDTPVKFYLHVDRHMYTHQITQHHLCYSSWYSRVFQDHIKPHIHDKNNTRYTVAAGHKYFSDTYLESWFTERPLCHTGILVHT